MSTRLHAILFLILASVFCVKEIASVKFVSTEYTCCMEDMGEDESPAPDGETDSDEEKNETKPMLSGMFNHEFGPASISGIFHKTYCESLLHSPYFEIHLPPPEQV